MSERLRGTIMSSNPVKKHGVIQGEDGTQYFYFERETPSFDFEHCYGFTVTFTAVRSNGKIAGLSFLARNIERDLVTADFKAKQRCERRVERERGTSSKEEVLRQRYGANYVPLSQRRDDWLAKTSTVPVSH